MWEYKYRTWSIECIIDVFIANHKTSVDSRHVSDVTHIRLPVCYLCCANSKWIMMSASSDSRAPDFVWRGECDVDPGGTRLVQLLRDRRLLVFDIAQVSKPIFNNFWAPILSSCRLPKLKFMHMSVILHSQDGIQWLTRFGRWFFLSSSASCNSIEFFHLSQLDIHTA